MHHEAVPFKPTEASKFVFYAIKWKQNHKNGILPSIKTTWTKIVRRQFVVKSKKVVFYAKNY